MVTYALEFAPTSGVILLLVFGLLMFVLVLKQAELLDLLFTVGLLVAGTAMVIGHDAERTAGMVALVGGLCLVRLRVIAKHLEKLRKAAEPPRALPAAMPGTSSPSADKPIESGEGAEANSKSESKA